MELERGMALRSGGAGASGSGRGFGGNLKGVALGSFAGNGSGGRESSGTQLMRVNCRFTLLLREMVFISRGQRAVSEVISSIEAAEEDRELMAEVEEQAVTSIEEEAASIEEEVVRREGAISSESGASSEPGSGPANKGGTQGADVTETTDADEKKEQGEEEWEKEEEEQEEKEEDMDEIGMGGEGPQVALEWCRVVGLTTYHLDACPSASTSAAISACAASD